MDPLSIIASTLAITQALGIGIKKLRSIANTSTEFLDMLNELSTLQGLLSQLEAAEESLGDSQLPATVLTSAANQLETVRIELAQIVKALTAMTSKLLDRAPRPFRESGEGKLSIVQWQRVRGKVLQLRNQARQCRDNLSACLGLLGLSQT